MKLDLFPGFDAAAESAVENSVAEASWSYEEAFCRNLGLITAAEQQKLRLSRVAIAGMGGVGGVHLMTLARLGIGKFTIADPDAYEVGNFNRQFGATTRTLGQNKAEVMAAEAQAVNPDLDIRVFSEAVTRDNVHDFLGEADLFLDGVDFFALEARRLLFRTAYELGMWGVTAGPIGFSAAWLTFDPQGMSFDSYFDLRDGMDRRDQLIAFAVGLAPAATHLGYMDLSRVSLDARTGPSASLACQLASGVASSEILRILLGRPVRAVPSYAQFDPFAGKLCRGRLWWGNRHPWQRFKRWFLKRTLIKRAIS